jgi:hypothetical protein
VEGEHVLSIWELYVVFTKLNVKEGVSLFGIYRFDKEVGKNIFHFNSNFIISQIEKPTQIGVCI